MIYFIIILLALAGFIFGFAIIMLLFRLFRYLKPVSDAPVKEQPVIQPVNISETVIVAAEPEAAPVLIKPEEPKNPAFFTLSRNDVLDHILDMQKKENRFSIKPFVNEKTDEKTPDFLMCGGWCFGMMFDRNDIVFNFILRMDEDIADHYAKIYTIQSASTMPGENWYSLTVDRVFQKKSEVFMILDDCYDFTLKTCFAKKKKDNAEAVIEEQSELEKRLAENLSLVEKTIAAAEKNYRDELEKFKAAQSVVQPIVQPIVQPVIESVAQPVIQPAVELVAQPVAQPVIQPAVELVAQPVAQPVIQPVVEPVAQAIEKPVLQTIEPETIPVLIKPDEQKKPEIFTLSRNDVIDHILKMQKNGERFPVRPDINEKINEKMPDYLMCGGWCFGMMFDRNDIVFNFIFRMSEEMANRYGRVYTVQSAPSISGEKWYSLTIDRFFENKNEVYVILEDCCEFTLREHFTKRKKDNGVTEKAEPDVKAEQPIKAELSVKAEQVAKTEPAAKADQPKKVELPAKAESAAKEEQIIKTEQDEKTEQDAQEAKAKWAELEKRMLENLSLVEKTTIAAEMDYRAKLEKYKEKHYSNFYITRKELADETRKLENPDITIIERPKQPQLPMSLRYKDKTYAMLHGTETGVFMIVRLSDEYAESLVVKHPEICRTRFPKGANWYQLPVDGAFKDKESVCRVLNISREFVAGKIASSKHKKKRNISTKQAQH